MNEGLNRGTKMQLVLYSLNCILLYALGLREGESAMLRFECLHPKRCEGEIEQVKDIRRKHKRDSQIDARKG